MAARASRRFVPIRSTADFTRDRERERIVIGWEKRGEKKKGKREAERAIPPGIGQSARLYHRFTRTARQIFDFHVVVKEIQYLPSVFP